MRLLLLDHGHLLHLRLRGAGLEHRSAGHDLVGVHVQALDRLAQQLRSAVHADDLLHQRAGERHLQELVAANLGSLLGDERQRTARDDLQIALEVRIRVVLEQPLVGALDRRCDDVDVDGGDRLLDLLGGVADHHRHARGRAAGAALPACQAGHVARDAAVLVGQLGELLEHAHQLVGVAARHEEVDGLGRGAHRVARRLPNLPGVHLGDVLAGRDAVDVHAHLRAGADAHVVGQRAGGAVAHVLAVLDAVVQAVVPEGARHAAVAVGVVRAAVQRIGVDDGLDDPVADQPGLDLVLLGRVWHLVLGHAPVDQVLARHAAPVLECVDEVGVVLVGRQGVAALGLGAHVVHLGPLVQTVATVLVQHRRDGVVVVAVNALELVQVAARELVALDQVTVVHRAAPGGRVDVERVNTLPLDLALGDGGGLEGAVGLLLPLELALVAHDRALDEGRLEDHQVVQELVQGFLPAAFDQHVLDLDLGALGVDASGLHDLVLEVLLGVQQRLADVRNGGRLPDHLELHDLLLHGLHDGADLLGRQLGLGCGGDGPGLLGARANEHVGEQRLGLSRLGGEQHHVNLAAALFADACQHVGVVVAPAASHGRQHVQLGLLLGFLGQAPVVLDVRDQRGDHWLVVGFLRSADRRSSFVLFCLHGGKGLHRQNSADVSDRWGLQAELLHG